MRRLVSSTRYLALIGVFGLGVVSVAAFIWGAVETALFLWTLATSALTSASDKEAIVGLPHVLDVFLIAAILILAALSLYELFIGELDVRDALVVRDLDALKAKVIGIVVVIMGLTFLEHLVEWRDPTGTLAFGIARAAVALVLTLFYRSNASH